MRERLRTAALRLFPRLPVPLRRAIVRRATPQHSVGAVCVIEHEGEVLFLHQHHRRGLTLPGGLLARGETAAQAVVREVAEETGLHVQVGLPVATVVAPVPRRVDVVYRVVAHGPRPSPTPAGEATDAVWMGVGDADVDDPSTRDILEVFRRASEQGAHAGRVL